MTNPKFPKMLDYEALKQQFSADECNTQQQVTATEDTVLHFTTENTNEKKPTGLTGSRLRSYAFAVLTRKEYSKAELIEKLNEYAENIDEVSALVNELAHENYQSDQRVAEIVLSSQKRKGKGPNRIKHALKNKKVDANLISEELRETDWLSEAYALKVKKFGPHIEKDPKLKAKQMRFLMYRGFDLDIIMKVINKHSNEFYD